MDHRELKRLVQLMNENGLVELEIEREGSRIHLRKSDPTLVAAPMGSYPAGLPAGFPGGYPGAFAAPPAGAAGDAAGTATEGAGGPPPGTKDLPSPMVGTFYRRPSPDADPYVDAGDRIDGETVVCIIEAMKVNNEIKAEMSGEIVEVLVEDGQPVEFGEPLFRVKVG